MNKLAVLAFSLLLFFSTMLWYLANGSLNEYLKSQIVLQGEYYSGQKAVISLVDYSPDSNITMMKGLTLANLDTYQANNVLEIDKIQIDLSENQNQRLMTKISKVTINKLTLNVEQTKENNNIEQLIKKISSKLANDYPQLYPQISAEIYAKNNPELNAEQYSKDNPQAGPIIEHTKKKKSRGKALAKVIISAISINHLELNTMVNGVSSTIQKRNVNVGAIGDSEGLVGNQLGGEVLLNLLKLADKQSNNLN